MGQNARRPKKGRPPKVDLGANDAPPQEVELRRSHRRRNVRYLFDLDDYFDDEGIFEDYEEQQKREKKLKLLLNVECKDLGATSTRVAASAEPSRIGDVQLPHPSSSSENEKPSKKRKINEDTDNLYCEDVAKFRGSKSEPKANDLLPGAWEVASPCGLPLANKKEFELILDELQKKDIYRVYAEPVDPDELPGYHDVIKNPMDFATMRNKLSDGLYSTLNQFESDVFLICSNAMQFNAPVTVYYKQARSILELAKKKFSEMRLNIPPLEKESQSELKMRSIPILNQENKSSVGQMVHEPFRSDFSRGASLGAALGIPRTSNVLLTVGSERANAPAGPVESFSFLNDILDKRKESTSGKFSMLLSERKLSLFDEDRRATYENSLAHPTSSSEFVLSTFERETKQLVPVGVYSDNSYASSLARFAATLGPIAWKVASKRIELALPQDVKFGQGWVGEYDPLPTPTVVPENCNVKEPSLFSKKQSTDDPMMRGMTPDISVSWNKCLVTTSPVTVPENAQPAMEIVTEAKSSFIFSTGIEPITAKGIIHCQNSQSRNVVESKGNYLKQVESNIPPTSNKVALVALEVDSSICTSRNTCISSSGYVKRPDTKEAGLESLVSGNEICNLVGSNSVTSSSSDLTTGACYYPQRPGMAAGNNSARLMRMFADTARDKQALCNQSFANASQVLSSGSSCDSAAVAAARAWMSIGAGGLRPTWKSTTPFQNQIPADSPSNSTRNIPSQTSRFREESLASGMHYILDKHSSSLKPSVPEVPQAIRVGNDVQVQSQFMVLSPYENGDLSKYQFQSAWQSLNPQWHSSQKPESFSPNLNSGSKSSGSPRIPASGVIMESQHPDLALQL